MISVKIHKQGESVVIGACDEQLLGKKFVDGKFQIDVTKYFYDGPRVNKQALKKFLTDATIANLVGEETIQCAMEMGLINDDCILRIKGVPHAQMVRML